MASICIYTRSERLNATSIYVGRIHLFIGVFVPRAMSDGATAVAENWRSLMAISRRHIDRQNCP